LSIWRQALALTNFTVSDHVTKESMKLDSGVFTVDTGYHIGLMLIIIIHYNIRDYGFTNIHMPLPDVFKLSIVR
jgi:hypothetical protein